MAAKPSTPPKGTGPGGRRLWADVVDKYELEVFELALLREACRCVDQLDKLYEITEREGLVVGSGRGYKTHPAVTAAREMRLTLARVLAALRLPAGDAAEQGRRLQRRGPRGVYTMGSA